MSRRIRLALFIDLTALWCERFLPFGKMYLPVGGDHFTQAAALIFIAMLIDEFGEL